MGAQEVRQYSAGKSEKWCGEKKQFILIVTPTTTSLAREGTQTLLGSSANWPIPAVGQGGHAGDGRARSPPLEWVEKETDERKDSKRRKSVGNWSRTAHSREKHIPVIGLIGHENHEGSPREKRSDLLQPVRK